MGTPTVKNKLLSGLLAISIACTSASNVKVNSAPTSSELTHIDMDIYNTTRSPAPTPISIRSILGSDTARIMGAESLHIYDQNERNPARPYVRGPWNGLCLNEPSMNHIVASVGQVALNVQNDEFQRRQTLAAYAQRDIAILQSDFRLMTAGFQAQLHDRDISLQSAQSAIDTMRRNNVWTDIGIGLGGIILGLGVSGLLLLTD